MKLKRLKAGSYVNEDGRIRIERKDYRKWWVFLDGEEWGVRERIDAIGNEFEVFPFGSLDGAVETIERKWYEVQEQMKE